VLECPQVGESGTSVTGVLVAIAHIARHQPAQNRWLSGKADRFPKLMSGDGIKHANTVLNVAVWRKSMPTVTRLEPVRNSGRTSFFR